MPSKRSKRMKRSTKQSNNISKHSSKKRYTKMTKKAVNKMVKNSMHRKPKNHTHRKLKNHSHRKYSGTTSALDAAREAQKFRLEAEKAAKQKEAAATALKIKAATALKIKAATEAQKAVIPKLPQSTR